MRQLLMIALVSAGALLGTGCVIHPPAPAPAVPAVPHVAFGEVIYLSGQKLSDQALIDALEARGPDFSLAPGDSATLSKAGVSDGVVRYLEGRAAGERDVRRQVARDRYAYGYPYPYRPFLSLGFHGGHGHRHHH